jgi:HTH-type transcriptional regulator/antitoxin MqsA
MPNLWRGQLVHATQDVSHINKRQTTTVLKVTADFCPACNEAIMSMDEAEKYSKFIGEIKEQVNAQFVQPG